MAAKSRDFRDEFDDQLGKIGEMSDAELEALLSGHAPRSAAESTPVESLEPGSRLSGVVIDFRGGEVLVELDEKTHGIIAEGEFEGDELPGIGQRLQAVFERYDGKRELAILGVRKARREVFWDEVRPGTIVEGRVTEVNKGGLTLDIKGIRAFLPISQIERERVEDASTYLGTKLCCEVTSVDRADENLVVSRRIILERQAEELKGNALARLSEGEVLKGTIVKITEHGAFVDLGGVEGLLHSSKITERHRELGGEKALHKGQQVEVAVTRVDRERGRVSLDFHRLAGKIWRQAVEGYEVGDEATGWVSRFTPEGALVSLDEGVEGIVPRSRLLGLAERPKRGTILRVVVTSIDREKHRIELELADRGVGE